MAVKCHSRDDGAIMSTKTGTNLFDLTGRVAVITGGSKGLGLAVAHTYAAAGACVVLASRTEADVVAAANAVAAASGRPASESGAT